VIVSWDWAIPAGAATHSCICAVISSEDDPITTNETDVNILKQYEKRFALKNLHVIDSPGPRPIQTLATINFHNSKKIHDLIDIIIEPREFGEGTIGLLLEPVEFSNLKRAFYGVETYSLNDNENIGQWNDNLIADKKNRENLMRDKLLKFVDRKRIYDFDPLRSSELRGIRIKPNQTIHGVLTVKGSHIMFPMEEHKNFRSCNVKEE
jgi:hypothetical protein